MFIGVQNYFFRKYFQNLIYKSHIKLPEDPILYPILYPTFHILEFHIKDRTSYKYIEMVWANEKVKCECGGSYSKKNKAVHKKTKKCREHFAKAQDPENVGENVGHPKDPIKIEEDEMSRYEKIQYKVDKTDEEFELYLRVHRHHGELLTPFQKNEMKEMWIAMNL